MNQEEYYATAYMYTCVSWAGLFTIQNKVQGTSDMHGYGGNNMKHEPHAPCIVQ